MRRWALGGVVVAVLAGAAAPAHAKDVVIGDLAAPVELRDEAIAVSMLLRSMVRPTTRAVVSRQALAEALYALLGPGRREALVVDEPIAVRVMTKVGADRLFLGELARDGATLVATGQVLSDVGKRLASVEASAPRGEVWQLARDLAQQVAPRVEGVPVKTAPTSMLKLRPFVAASIALLGGNKGEAARHLELAPAGSAEEFSGAREIAEAVYRDPKQDVGARVAAALAVGEAGAAATLTDDHLGKDPRNVAARAGKVRALAALKDYDGAQRELSHLGQAMDHPLVVVAAADLSVRRGDPKEKRDALVRAVQSRPAAEQRPVLAFVQGTAPGTFSGEVETKIVLSASTLAKQEPNLAAAVAARAVQSGVAVAQAAPLLRPADLSGQELGAISQQLDKVTAAGAPIPGAERIRGELQQREEVARKIHLGQLGAVGQIQRDGESAGPLIDELVAVLKRIEPLAAHTYASLTLVPLAGGGAPFYSPVTVRTQRFESGLALALASPELNVRLAPPPAGTRPVVLESLGDSPERAMAALAAEAGADAVLLYRLTASGGDARLDLVLVDAGRIEALVLPPVALSGARTGLLRPNLPFLGSVAVILIVGLVVGGRRALAGSITVQIRRDFEPSEEALSIMVTRSADAAPTVGTLSVYLEDVKKNAGKQTATLAMGVKQQARFSGLAPGRWYVHLYGAYRMGKTTDFVVVKGENFSRVAILKSRENVTVVFALDVNTSEVNVVVTDKETPVPGARVWLNDARDRAIATNRTGRAVLQVPRGRHVVWIEVAGMKIERPLEIAKHGMREIAVSLDWERRVDKISRALETVHPAMAPGAAPPGATVRPGAGGPRAAVDRPAAGPAGLSAAGPLDLPPASRTSVPLPAMSMPPPARQPSGPPPADEPLMIFGGAPPPMATMNLPPRPTMSGRGAPAAPGAAGGGSAVGLSRYRTEKELGAGAMGHVFRARDIVLDRDVALKIIARDIRDNPEIAAKFVQEARALAALNHPNIVTVYDQGQDQGELYMVMELVEGGTLADLLATRGRLPIQVVVAIGDQLCAGVGYAHGKRIIHRDIKPSNIFVSPQGMVKIGDFGLARAIQRMRISQTSVQGTPLYMSPEQIVGKDIDFRADLYSIGCTLFEMLTGQPPFVEGEVLYHHLHTPPPRPSERVPGLSRAIDDVVLACLAKNKDARIPSAEHIRAALRAIIAGAPHAPGAAG